MMCTSRAVSHRLLFALATAWLPLSSVAAEAQDAVVVKRTVLPASPEEASEAQFAASAQRVKELQPTIGLLLRGLDGVGMQVLLPVDYFPDRMTGWFAQDHSYVANFDLGAGDVLEVFGTAIASVVEESANFAAPPPSSEELGYSISKTEVGMDLGFQAFESGYSLRVTCHDPSTDEKCTSEAFLLKVFEALALVNPGNP